MPTFKFTAYTDRGSRSINEDTYFAGKNLFIVCDGVGGSAYGEVASRLACSAIPEYFNANPLNVFDVRYLAKVLQNVTDKFRETITKYPELKTMSTTIAMIAFNGDGAIIAWLGDSRTYHIRKGKILYVTEDHSLINELRKQGKTEDSELKNVKQNIITHSLSIRNTDGFSTHRISKDNILPGDYLFLCSDGVLENINEQNLSEILNLNDSLEGKAKAIFKICEGRTGDNFTFQLIEV